MADSVDRVFVHALNTVKKIPKTGAARPPPQDRMRLYGLYKQAMEGDVNGVMERPVPTLELSTEDLQREQDKWDAWNSQRGLSRTEAKRRYIEALVETMHKYATTPSVLWSYQVLFHSLPLSCPRQAAVQHGRYPCSTPLERLAKDNY